MLTPAISSPLAKFSILLLVCAYVTHVTCEMSPLDTLGDGTNNDGRTPRAEDCTYLTDGIPGPPGPPGNFGEHGPPGPKGMDGLPGRDGYPGKNRTARGIPGERGDQGQPGPKGQLGSAGRPGPQGPPGRVGPPGPRGPPGEDVQGNLNATYGHLGDPGTVGLPGVKGEAGDPGRDGNCTCSEPAVDDTGEDFSAFSVARHSSLQSTNGDEIITWDHVFTNAIGDFDPDTGLLTCRIPGYYFFSFHVQKTASSQNTMVQLMHNGYHMGSALEYGDVDDEDSTTNSVVIHLDYDDQVWLQLYDTTGFYGSQHGYTTFHGYLQYAD